MNTPAVELNQNATIPQIGLGTWKLTGRGGKEAIKQAINLGYRHIDTAYHYQNHEAVGAALEESSVTRDEMFVTTKIWRDHLTKNKLNQQFDASLSQLGLNYVDLLLVHWPNQSVPIDKTLQAMGKLKKAGRIKAVGVSNFTKKLLREALQTGINVEVNQVEYHPTLVQQELKRFCDEHGITLTAYSPLGHNGRDLDVQAVIEIANSKGESPATIIVAWLIQQGIVAIPKAASKKHQKQNLQAREIDLSESEIKKIDDCDRNNRIISPDYGPFAADGKR